MRGLGAKLWARSCLARLQRWEAKFAGDLPKPLNDLFVQWDAVFPPLAFFLVFQESGIEHALLPWRWLGLTQPFEHLVHVLFEFVNIRKRRDVVCRKEVLIPGVTL